jgi:two-component system, cell cycle sensor histidine kinase and response regulator CckA
MPRPVRRHSLQERRDERDRRRGARDRATERRAARLAALADNNPHPMLELDCHGRIVCHNQAARPIVDAFRETAERGALHQELAGIVSRCLASGEADRGLRSVIGGRVFVWSFVPIVKQQVVLAYPEDATEADELRARMRQSEQLRSLGRLAGGVARAINNQLTVIGCAETSLREQAPHAQASLEFLDEIRRACERAASMTTRLVSFGRPQQARPRLLEPAGVVERFTGMLVPSLPGRLKLTVRMNACRGRVWADPREIQHVLLALVLDARDAVQGEGEIRLEGAVTRVGASGRLRHIGLRPGRYVTLTVADSGPTPPSPERSSRLAALHEIVKRRGGDLWMRSVWGEGTRCMIYLPLAAGRIRSRKPKERVLLVESDAAVRAAAVRCLRASGYRVMEAASAGRAARLAAVRRRAIHLMVADLSTCGGTDLVGLVRQAHPGVRTLFLAGASVPPTDCPILEKPFTPAGLASAVRDALDASVAPPGPIVSNGPLIPT